MLIIGAIEILGSDLYKVFPDAVRLTHQDLDITDREQVIESIQKIKPDVVINAATCTNMYGYEYNQELAFQVNKYESGYIVEACSKISTSLT